MNDTQPGLDRVRRQLTCAMRGHVKDWSPGFFGPMWRCSRCGKEGGLEEASHMPLGQHLIHAAVTAASLLGIWLLLRWIF